MKTQIIARLDILLSLQNEIPFNFLTIFLQILQRPRSKYDPTTKNNATI